MSNAAPIDLATMPIADKVSRYTQARYFVAQLSALQNEAERCRCHFVLAGSSDRMPADVEKHLSVALMVARGAYSAPTEPLSLHRTRALVSLTDGYAQALLRDILEALLALDIHFVIRPDGPDREHMKLERLLWGMSRLEPADTQETPLPLPVGTPRDDVDQFVQSFFKKLERPGNGEH